MRQYSITELLDSGLTDEALAAMLPPVVVEIAACVGIDAALRLVRAVGGVAYDVPKGRQAHGQRSAREQRLIDAIGDEAAAAFMAVYGGDTLYIPSCKPLLLELRNRKFVRCVHQAITAGMSKKAAVQQFAYEFGFSDRHGRSLLKKYRG